MSTRPRLGPTRVRWDNVRALGTSNPPDRSCASLTNAHVLSQPVLNKKLHRTTVLALLDIIACDVHVNAYSSVSPALCVRYGDSLSRTANTFGVLYCSGTSSTASVADSARFLLCRNMDGRAIEGMVKGRILDLR